MKKLLLTIAVLAVASAAYAGAPGRYANNMDDDDAEQTLYVPAPRKPLSKNAARAAYIRDCTAYGFSANRCASIWDGKAYANNQPVQTVFKHQPKARVQPEFEEIDEPTVKAPVARKAPTAEPKPVATVPLFDVDNEEYKARRAAALAKPNAFVEQYTFR